MSKSKFVDLFLEHLPAQGALVDLGAGDGRWAEIMAHSRAGGMVLAVDVRPRPEKAPVGVFWEEKTVQNWLDEAIAEKSTVDGFLLKNLIQFIGKEWVLKTLLPTLAILTRPGGVIAIETFQRPPQPSLGEKVYYGAAELEGPFNGWKVLLSEETEEQGKDLNNNPHTFFMTRIIVQKT